MRQTFRLVIAVAMFFGAFAGCSSSESDNAGTPTPTSVPVEDFKAALPALLCEKLDSCCALPPGPGCEADTLGKLDMVFAVLDKSTAVYDPKAAAACFKALKEIPNDCMGLIAAQANIRKTCVPVINGTIDPGEACGGVEECQRAPGMLGDIPTGFVGCEVLGGVGEARCRQFIPSDQAGVACELGFQGTEATVTVCGPLLHCKDGSCVTRPGVGQACPDANCLDSTCENGTCVALPGLDAACDNQQCAAGLECDQQTKVCKTKDPSTVYVGVGIGFRGVDSVCTP
jgi:hypothetical protein